MAAAVEALLAAAPDPESSRAFLNRIRSESPLAFERVAKSPMALRCAVSLPSYSRFLLESVRPRLIEMAQRLGGEPNGAQQTAR